MARENCDASGAEVVLVRTPPPRSSVQLADGRWVRITVSNRHTTATAGKLFTSLDAADATDDVTYLPSGAEHSAKVSFFEGEANEITVVFRIKPRVEVESPTIVRVATTQTLDVCQIKVGKGDPEGAWVGVEISSKTDVPDSSNGRAWKDRTGPIYEPQSAVIVPNRPGVYRVAAILHDERVVAFRVEVAEALADPDVADRPIPTAAQNALDDILTMGGVPIVPASPRIDRRAT